MGEAFFRRQAAGFRHSQNRAYNSMMALNLISASRPEVIGTEYRCEMEHNGTTLTKGETVVLLQSSDGAELGVLRGNQRVGTVAGADDNLRFAVEAGGGLICAEVASTSVIVPTFLIRIEESL